MPVTTAPHSHLVQRSLSGYNYWIVSTYRSIITYWFIDITYWSINQVFRLLTCAPSDLFFGCIRAGLRFLAILNSIIIVLFFYVAC
jgi:hypothetical protein